MKKKLFLFLFSGVLFTINLQAQIPTTGIELDHDTIVLALDADTTLVATVLPSTATEKRVTWEVLASGLSFIDTVLNDNSCTITGIDVGTARIVVKAVDGNWKDTCVVRVVIPVTEVILLCDDTVRMALDTDTVLIATLEPHDATDKIVFWTNSSPEIVRVESVDDTTCFVVALKTGEALLFAEIHNFDGSILTKDSCVIEVNALAVDSLVLNTDSLTLLLDQEAELMARFVPASGIDKEVNWSSTNPQIVELLSQGRDTVYRIRAKALGEALIYAKSLQDPLVYDSCVVTVLPVPPAGVVLNKDTIEMDLNSEIELIAYISPPNTTFKRVEWTSTDSTIVNFKELTSNDTTRIISALKPGIAKIAAKTVDGEFTDTCVIHVIVPVDSVVMSRDSITLKIDSTYVLKAIIHPDTAYYHALKWKVKDTTIVDFLAIVNDSIATIKAYKAGITYVYATSTDGKTKDSCVVTVDSIHVTGVKISEDIADLCLDDVLRLTATIKPSKASNPNMIWTISDTTVLKLLSPENASYCEVKGKKLGKAIIHVHTEEGNFNDFCVVNVVPLGITKFALERDSMVCYIDNDFYTYHYPLNVIIKPTIISVPVKWSSSDTTIVGIGPGSMDSICFVIPKRAGSAFVFAKTLDGQFKDSCFVTAKEQFLALETDTVFATRNGVIELSLIIPDNALVAGSFELHLPYDFGLTHDENGFRTTLADDLKDNYKLSINRLTDSVYVFYIHPNITPSSGMKTRSGVSLIKLMDISFTIYEDYLDKLRDNFVAKLIDVVFKLNDDTILEEDLIEIIIKSYRNETGNPVILNPAQFAYIYNKRLYVDSDKAEIITVYSMNGQLLFNGIKPDGQAVFDVNSSEKVVIVKGSSGWTNKVVNP